MRAFGMNRNRFAIGVLAAAAFAASPSFADVVYGTNDPFGSFLGINGFDVFEQQSVATRFVSTGDYTLDRVSLWLWNNDEGGGEPSMVITLRADNPAGGESRPSDQILETWNFNLPNTGVFNPILYDFDSVDAPALASGTRYWLVAESSATGGADPVWAWAANEAGWISIVNPQSGDDWWDASSGAVVAATVEGTPAGGPAGDVDGDGDVDLNDLSALLSSFGLCTGDGGFNAAADFDTSNCIELGDLALLLANFGS